ncbi:MAG: rhodanese-like domain-containing protein [Oceanidesulfovibrio sp.]
MRSFLIACAGILVAAILTVGWNPIWRAVGVAQLEPETLKMWLTTKPPAGSDPPLLVDVRTRLEYTWFHIPNAVHAPGVIWGDTAAVEGRMAGRSVVLICMTGHRSQVAALSLMRGGAADVRNLEWGMAGWLLEDGPVVSSDNAPAGTTDYKGDNDNG